MPGTDDISRFAGRHRAQAHLGTQQALFADEACVQAVQPEPSVEALAARLPAGLRLGTSSWSFPGWRGLVYQGSFSEQLLARGGLAAYADHPLFSTVSIDRSYYRPLSAQAYAGYANSVPRTFKFMVKAPAALTTPSIRQSGKWLSNPHLLDPAHAMRFVVEPVLDGLGAGADSRLGVLVFQFPPLRGPIVSQPQRFVQRLERFLKALPIGPPYAVEIRNQALASPGYYRMLEGCGVTPCVSVHPSMPDLIAQATQVLASSHTLPVAVRWNLRSTLDYETAKRQFSPFDTLSAPDTRTRALLARLARRALAQGRDIYIIANNKAEGCAPLTLRALAAAIERDRQDDPVSEPVNVASRADPAS